MSTQIGSIELIASIDTSQYKKGAKEIHSANKDIEGSAESSSSKLGSAFVTGAKIAAAAVVALSVVAVKSFVQAGSEIQSLRASFESLTGNVTDTNKVMTSLYDLGKKTAFENKDIQAAGRNYLAAGVSVDKLNDILSYTADIAGATGANLGQLTLPLTQTIARGKLQTQDFYQILNSGAGALRKPLTELAGKKGFGTLAEAMEKGKITADDLVGVMKDVTKEGGFAFKGAIKQSETFNGRMSNLKEAITQVGLGILGVDAITGTVNPEGAFAKLSTAVSAATEFIIANQDQLKKVGAVFSEIKDTLIKFGREALDYLAPKFMALWETISTKLIPTLKDLWKNYLEPLVPVIGVALVVALGLTIDAINLAVTAFSGISNWINNNTPIVIGFVATLAILKGAMVFNAVVNALIVQFNIIKLIQIPQLIASFEALQAAVATPIVMPAILIGAALAAIWKVRDEGIKLQKILDDASNAATGASNSRTQFGESLKRRYERGEITKEQRAQIWRDTAPQLANGGIVMPSPGGTFANIAEAGEAEAVIPLSKLDKMINGNGGGNREINIGTINIADQTTADYFIRKLSNMQEITSNGLTPNLKYSGA